MTHEERRTNRKCFRSVSPSGKEEELDKHWTGRVRYGSRRDDCYR